MWAQAMRAIQDSLPYESFSPPVRTGDEGAIQVEIPDVIGMSTRRAAQRLAAAGFYVSIGDRAAFRRARGQGGRDEPGTG